MRGGITLMAYSTSTPHYFNNFVKLGPKIKPYSTLRKSILIPSELYAASDMTALAPPILQKIDYYAPGCLRKLFDSNYDAINPNYSDDMALVKDPKYRVYAAEYLDILPTKQKYLSYDYLFNFGKNIQTVYNEECVLKDRRLTIAYDNMKYYCYDLGYRRAMDVSIFEKVPSRFLWSYNSHGDYETLINEHDDLVPAFTRDNTHYSQTKGWTSFVGRILAPDNVYLDEIDHMIQGAQNVLEEERKNQGLPGEMVNEDQKENIPPPQYQFEPSTINDQAINPTWYQSAAKFEELQAKWIEKKNQVTTNGDDNVLTMKDTRYAIKKMKQEKIKTFRAAAGEMQKRKSIARCHRTREAINQALFTHNPLEILTDLLTPLVSKLKNTVLGIASVVQLLEKLGDVRTTFENKLKSIGDNAEKNIPFLVIWVTNLFISTFTMSSFVMHWLSLCTILVPELITTLSKFLLTLVSKLASEIIGTARNQGSSFCLASILGEMYKCKLPRVMFTDLLSKMKAVSCLTKGVSDGFKLLKYVGKAFERVGTWLGMGSLRGTNIPTMDYTFDEWASDVAECQVYTTNDMVDPLKQDLMTKVIKAAAAVSREGVLRGYESNSQIWIKACVTSCEQLSKTWHAQLRMVVPSFRPAPIWISLAGGPGVGKSLVMQRIGKALFHPKADPPIKRLVDRDNLFYYCSTNTKYDDQYRNHPIYGVDDIYQQKTIEGCAKDESDSMKMINYNSTVPAEINNSQAGLKGGILMSEVIMTNSNIIYPHPPEITDVRALHRRVTVNTWVDRIDEKDYTPASLRYYVLPSVLAVSDRGDFIELSDSEKMPAGYRLFTMGEWKSLGPVILSKVAPMTEKQFVAYCLKLWKERVAFVENTDFGKDVDDDFFDAVAPARTKFVRKNQASRRSVMDNLISTLAGLTLFGYAYKADGWARIPFLISGAICVISVLYDMLTSVSDLIRNNGGPYNHDKNTVARMNLRPKNVHIITWKNNGNLVNTKDNIRQMSVSLTLRCGLDHYSFSGLAYGGRNILVNEHCLGVLFNNEHRDVTIEVTDYQKITRKYAIDQSMVRGTDSDIAVLTIKDMPQWPKRDHMFVDVLPKHAEKTDVFTYCVRTQTFEHAWAKMNASAPNDIPVTEPPPDCQHFKADMYPYYYCHYITVYNQTMKPGDCGSPVIDTVSGKIMGIHVATAGSVDDFVPFTRDCLPPSNGFEMPDQRIVDDIENPALKVNQLNANYVSRKSNLVQSPLFNIFPCTKVPAPLKRNSPNGDPLPNGFAKGFPTSKPYPQADVDRAVEFVSSAVRAYKVSSIGRRELTHDETLNGVPGELHGMILSTSAGTPYKKKCDKPGKYSIIGMDENGHRDWTDEEISLEVQDRIDIIEKDLAKGIVPAEYMTEQLKDETIKLAKAEIGKTRTFRTLPVTMNYLYRKYFGAMVAAVEKNPDQNEVALGLNVHGPHWTRLYHRLNRFGGNVLAGDYANWDRRLSSQLIFTLKRICAAFYGYESVERDTLIDYLVSSPVILEDLMYYPRQGLPSGVAMTTLFGSLINYVVITLAIAHMLEKAGRLDLLRHDMMEFTFYGDDHIVALHKELQKYVNFMLVQEYMTEYGLGYTPADKSDRKFEFENLCDVPYLKRTFKVLSRSLVQAPLEMDSIENMPQWQDYRLPGREFIEAVWASMCQELVYYGKETFMEKMQLVLERANEECDVRGWERLRLCCDYNYYYNNWIEARAC